PAVELEMVLRIPEAPFLKVRFRRGQRAVFPFAGGVSAGLARGRAQQAQKQAYGAEPFTFILHLDILFHHAIPAMVKSPVNGPGKRSLPETFPDRPPPVRTLLGSPPIGGNGAGFRGDAPVLRRRRRAASIP